MPDFTVHKYTRLLEALIEQGYHFQTFHEYLTSPQAKCIVLRHDVDKRPQNSLTLARLEHSFGLKGVYNFRSVPQSWDENVIKEISLMGHEIGYHYEELSIHKGDTEKAFESFKKNLGRLRKLVPVSTITMHGSPKSKHDSRDLWATYNYQDLGLIGEPYFDIDFSKVLYLTDTGRKWDGYKVSIRDKVNDEKRHELSRQGYPLHSTNDIIKATKEHVLPNAVMINIHPQRWHQNTVLWLSELVSQNVKKTSQKESSLEYAAEVCYPRRSKIPFLKITNTTKPSTTPTPLATRSLMLKAR